MNTTLLHNRIMRRVYYAYALRILTGPFALQVVLLASLGFLLTRFVSVGSVVQNLLEVKVGRVGVFFYEAVTHTEIWTLFIVAVMCFILVRMVRSRSVFVGQKATFV